MLRNTFEMAYFPQTFFLSAASNLTRPQFITSFANYAHLDLHLVIAQWITLDVRREATLRTDSQILQRSLSALKLTLSHCVSGIENLLLDLVLVLHIVQLGGHDTEDEVLVSWKLFQGLKRTGTRSVVFEIVCCRVELGEELGSNAVVPAFGEVVGVDEVTCLVVSEWCECREGGDIAYRGTSGHRSACPRAHRTCSRCKA